MAVRRRLLRGALIATAIVLIALGPVRWIERAPVMRENAPRGPGRRGGLSPGRRWARARRDRDRRVRSSASRWARTRRPPDPHRGGQAGRRGASQLVEDALSLDDVVAARAELVRLVLVSENAHKARELGRRAPRLEGGALEGAAAAARDRRDVRRQRAGQGGLSAGRAPSRRRGWPGRTRASRSPRSAVPPGSSRPATRARTRPTRRTSRSSSPRSGLEERRARYVCEIVALGPEGEEIAVNGTLEGSIAGEARAARASATTRFSSRTGRRRRSRSSETSGSRATATARSGGAGAGGRIRRGRAGSLDFSCAVLT